MFEKLKNIFKMFGNKEKVESIASKDTAKERLHLVLMQDRANVSADFLELMKQEIIEVIKKYIEIDEGAIDVRLTNKSNDDGTSGAPALYANIPIVNIKHENGKNDEKIEELNKEKNKKEEKKTDKSKENETTENTKETENKDDKKEGTKKEENTKNK